MFIISHIKKTFNNQIIFHDISYDFSANGIYIIKGKSGIGKSTLLHIMAGYDDYDSGWIEHDNLKIKSIFQNHELINELTVKDNIFISKQILNYECEYENHVIETLGIKKLLDFYPEKLSGGQKQRVSIARTLCSDFDILLCDEPTEFLDFEYKRKLMSLLLELSKTKIIIIATHDPYLIEQDATILTLKKGQLIVEKQIIYNQKRDQISQLLQYRQEAVKTYIKKITCSKNKKQISFIGLSIIIAMILFLIYGKVFTYKEINKVMNKDYIYVSSISGVADIEGSVSSSILSFAPYDDGITTYPINVFPYHEDFDTTSIKIVGNYPQDKDDILINSNMASILMENQSLSYNDLVDHPINLKLKTATSYKELSFNICGIVDEDAGLYNNLYYNKKALDQKLKGIKYEDQILYNQAYYKTDLYELKVDDYKKTYNQLSKFIGYQLFHIEISQNIDTYQITTSYKVYFMAFLCIYIAFQVLFILYNLYKDVHYYLSSFSILHLFGAKIKDIKKYYMLSKLKYLMVIGVSSSFICVIVNIIFVQGLIWLFYIIYLILVISLISFFQYYYMKKFRKKSFTKIFKEDKDIHY